MVFIYRVGSFFFFFSFSMNDLMLNDVTLILGTADMKAYVSIETRIKYDKLLILMKKMTEWPI
jgi:hypothetical protein